MMSLVRAQLGEPMKNPVNMPLFGLFTGFSLLTKSFYFVFPNLGGRGQVGAVTTKLLQILCHFLDSFIERINFLFDIVLNVNIKIGMTH